MVNKTKAPTIKNPGNPDLFGETTYIPITQELKSYLIAYSGENETLAQTIRRLIDEGMEAKRKNNAARESLGQAIDLIMAQSVRHNDEDLNLAAQKLLEIL